MFKKIFFLSALALTIQAFGITTYENQVVSSSNDQLNHIKNQMLDLKRAWKSEQLRIKMAQKASLTIYQKMSSVFEKIIASNDFTTKLNNAISSQVDAIVNNNATFNSVKTEFNISDFFPNMTINEMGKKLFSAMANKVYYLELGKQLAQKIQELKMTSAIQPQETPSYSE